jgi:hypothetical protein
MTTGMPPPTWGEVFDDQCIRCARIHCPVHALWSAQGDMDGTPEDLPLPKWTWSGDRALCEGYVPDVHEREQLAIADLFARDASQMSITAQALLRDVLSDEGLLQR